MNKIMGTEKIYKEGISPHGEISAVDIYTSMKKKKRKSSKMRMKRM